MTKTLSTNIEAAPHYRIGAVSRLTGIPTDTLRIWERRYTVVSPQRSPKGGRRYSRKDVQRLSMIKRLVDAGHAIGSIAALQSDQLEQRLGAIGKLVAGPDETHSALHPCRIAVLGEALPARLLHDQEALKDVKLLAATSDESSLLQATADQRADLLVLEYPSLTRQVVDSVLGLLEATDTPRALVIYAFAREQTLDSLPRQVAAVRAPVRPADLLPWCRPARLPESTSPDGSALTPAPARRFTAAQLAQVATLSTTVKCECPHHLADLVFALRSFEAYSAECEHQSTSDALLHARLHTATGHARALLETALDELLAAEGIRLDDLPHLETIASE